VKDLLKRGLGGRELRRLPQAVRILARAPQDLLGCEQLPEVVGRLVPEAAQQVVGAGVALGR